MCPSIRIGQAILWQVVKSSLKLHYGIGDENDISYLNFLLYVGHQCIAKKIIVPLESIRMYTSQWGENFRNDTTHQRPGIHWNGERNNAAIWPLALHIHSARIYEYIYVRTYTIVINDEKKKKIYRK